MTIEEISDVLNTWHLHGIDAAMHQFTAIKAERNEIIEPISDEKYEELKKRLFVCAMKR